MILVLDNYDSFTWNLVQYFGELGAEVRVVRNDAITLDEVAALAPERIDLQAVLAGRLPAWNLWTSLRSLFYPHDIPAAHDALQHFDLADKLFERVDRLSGGERQRVGLSRALLTPARLWLIDEPLSALDPTRGRQAITALTDEARARGITLVATLHHVEMALAHFPRILGLRDGALAFGGLVAPGALHVQDLQRRGFDGGHGKKRPLVDQRVFGGGSGAEAAVTVDPKTGGITAIDVTSPGTGYTSAPTVRVLDGNADNPTGAVVRATIAVARIDVVDPGAGYVAAPDVVISDSSGGTGLDATATATIAMLGAVSDITVTAPGKGYLTPGLKKFVDTLPGLGKGAANNLGNYIPVAVPDTTTYPGTDYYEIGVVQYRQQFHSSLPATLLRGYVQLSTPVVPGDHVALTNANLDPSQPGTPVTLPDGSQVYGVDAPHYLGPTIVATKDRPVRILFRNLLPTGSGGDLFLPVDTTLMGAGAGPGKDGDAVPGAMMLDPTTKVPMDMADDQQSVLDGVRNPMCGNSPKNAADKIAANRGVRFAKKPATAGPACWMPRPQQR